MKRLGSPLTLLTLLAGCVTVSGCTILQPQPDPSRFFTLTAIPEAQAPHDISVEGGTTGGRVYGLGPIKLSAYLDRNEIATRKSATELTYSDRDRWAEPLQANASRAVLQNLAGLLAPDRVVDFPWPPGLKVDYQIEIDVLQFERVADGTIRLAARWRIKDARKGGYRVIKESQLTHPSGAGTSEAVAAMSVALGDLSREIASTLGQFASNQ